jgi:hypothetical protein
MQEKVFTYHHSLLYNLFYLRVGSPRRGWDYSPLEGYEPILRLTHLDPLPAIEQDNPLIINSAELHQLAVQATPDGFAVIDNFHFVANLHLHSPLVVSEHILEETHNLSQGRKIALFSKAKKVLFFLLCCIFYGSGFISCI